MPTQKIFDQLLIFVNLYQHAKNQFISLFILQIPSILESHQHTGYTIFDHAHPQNLQSPFNLRQFAPASKKSFYSISSFLRYSQF